VRDGSLAHGEKESRNRVCLLCGKPHTAFSRRAYSFLCSACRTPKMRKEEDRVKAQLRRARQQGVPATLTIAEWVLILDHFAWKCAYCRTKPYQIMEHIISVTKGGGTIASNIVPCCIRCNRLKDNLTTDRSLMIPAETIARVQEELTTFLACSGIVQ
jgi:5-methylcytosine-specific restriction endonuclease McrA